MAGQEALMAAAVPSFGAWLRAHRKQHAWTQESFAEEVGCATITIRRLETDRYSPSPGLIQRILQVLNVPAADHSALIAWACGIEPVVEVQAETALPAPPVRPRPRTALVGRETLLRSLYTLIIDPQVRLVTLMGLPGVGKTRLALALADAEPLQAEFSGGVWFVSLVDVADPAQVLATIARTCSPNQATHNDPLTVLTTLFRDQRVLLILDNLEQVSAAASDLSVLLDHIPTSSLLVTSRVPLHLYGEHSVSVPPLALPAKNAASAAEVAASPAVQLWLQRVRAVQHDFILTDENASMCAALCRRLDGIPLALELSAARVPLLSLPALVQQLDKGLGVLGSGPSDLPERHRSLLQAIAWSYALLTPSEQQLFRCFGRFVGGCTALALAVVGGGESTGQFQSAVDDSAWSQINPQLLYDLEALMRHQLVQRESEQLKGGPRYRMLQTIQTFAFQQLQEQADAADYSQRHAEYYTWLLETLPYPVGTADWRTLIEPEVPNITAALEFLQQSGQLAAAARIVRHLWHYGDMAGRFTDTRAWISSLLAQPDTIPLELQADLHHGMGRLALKQGDFDVAAQHFQQGYEQYQRIGQRYGMALMRDGMGLTAMYAQQFSAALLAFEDSLIMWRQLNEQRRLAGTLLNCGILLLHQDDVAGASVSVQESLELLRSAADQRGVGVSLCHLVLYALLQNDYDHVSGWLDEAEVIAQRLGDQPQLSVVRYLRGMLAALEGDYPAAASWMHDSLAMQLNIRDMVTLVRLLEGCAFTVGMQGSSLLTGMLHTAAQAVQMALGNPLAPAEQRFFGRLRMEVQAHLDATTYDHGLHLAQTMTWQQVVTVALDSLNEASEYLGQPTSA